MPIIGKGAQQDRVISRNPQILPTRFDSYQLYFLSFWFGQTWMGLWKRSSVWGNNNISNIYSNKCDNFNEKYKYGLFVHHDFHWGAKNKEMLIYVNLVTNGVTLESLEITLSRSVTRHFPLSGTKLNEYKSFKDITAWKLSFSWSNRGRRGVSNLTQRRPLRQPRNDQWKN